jgi:undecaprenyl-diphosphatase
VIGAARKEALLSILRRDRQGLSILLWALLLVLAVWVFIEVADEVLEGEAAALDRRILLALREPGDPANPLGPRWLEEVWRDITALGGFAVLALMTVAVAGYLALARQLRALALLATTTLGGLALSTLLKGAFARPRPDFVSHQAYVATPGFPSGHSMLATVVYLTLGVLLARVVAVPRFKLYALAVAIVMSFLVGVSRVYLGVHFPSDVLAGWAAGLAWGALCWLAARSL